MRQNACVCKMGCLSIALLEKGWFEFDGSSGKRNADGRTRGGCAVFVIDRRRGQRSRVEPVRVSLIGKLDLASVGAVGARKRTACNRQEAGQSRAQRTHMHVMDGWLMRPAMFANRNVCRSDCWRMCNLTRTDRARKGMRVDGDEVGVRCF